jgi:putative hydrolase of the HAD superfamily
LPRLPGIRCILFDVYGTLLISGSGDIDAMQQVAGDEALEAALEAVGWDYQPGCGAAGVELVVAAVKRCHEQLRARGTAWPEVEIRQIWEEVLAVLRQRGLLEGGMPDDRQRLEEFAIEYELRVNPVWPMPEAVETVRALAKSFRVGIVSNAQFYTPLTLQRFCKDWGIERALCAWSFEQRCAKPDPLIFTPVLHRLEADGILPQAVLYVGNDRLNDVMTAASCGCRTALFAGEKRSLRLRSDVSGIETVVPDAVLTELAQLRELVTV